MKISFVIATMFPIFKKNLKKHATSEINLEKFKTIKIHKTLKFFENINFVVPFSTDDFLGAISCKYFFSKTDEIFEGKELIGSEPPVEVLEL